MFDNGLVKVLLAELFDLLYLLLADRRGVLDAFVLVVRIDKFLAKL